MSSSMVLSSDHTTMSTSLNLGEDLHYQTRNNDHIQTAAVTVRRSGTTNGNTNSNIGRRKSTRAGNEGCKKKQPQRGMGVAQLERLRLQERWKKITQINSPISSANSSISSPSTITTNLNDTSFFAAETKAQFPKFPGFGNGVVAGFHGQGFVSDHHHDMLQGYLYGIGNMININGNSKELSSTPKVNNKCFADHCADCHKKKRTYAGENMIFNEINKYANSHPVAGCDFTGLNVGTVKGGSPPASGGHDLPEKKATFLPSLGFCNTDQEVEVVAVQKNKGSSGGSSSVGIPNINGGVTEYEFFPGKGGYRSNIGLSSSTTSSPRHNELLMMKKLMGKSSSSSSDSESPSAVIMMAAAGGGGGGGGGGDGGGEASPSSRFTTTSTNTNTAAAALTGGVSVDASTSIDLSLRLSY